MEAPAPGVGISAAVERRSPQLPPTPVTDDRRKPPILYHPKVKCILLLLLPLTRTRTRTRMIIIMIIRRIRRNRTTTATALLTIDAPDLLKRQFPLQTADKQFTLQSP